MTAEKTQNNMTGMYWCCTSKRLKKDYPHLQHLEEEGVILSYITGDEQFVSRGIDGYYGTYNYVTENEFEQLLSFRLILS